MTLFQHVEEKKLPLNIVIYNTLIGGMCKVGNLAEAKALFCKLPSQGLQHNLRTYNIMTDGHLCGGLVGEAQNLHREMKDKGCTPDECTLI